MAKWERGKRKTIGGKKQWKKNGKLMLCNKTPPILRGDHHHFLCKWPQGFQSSLSLKNTPEASVNEIKRVEFVYLSKQVCVRRFATLFGFRRGAGLQKWLKNDQNESAPPLHFILLMGELSIEAIQWHILSFFHLLKGKEGMVKILVEGCCVGNCPAGGLGEVERTVEVAE